MTTVSISDSGWLASQPERAPGDLIRMVFSLAAEHDWTIVAHGQHERRNLPPTYGISILARMPAMMRKAKRWQRLTR